MICIWSLLVPDIYTYINQQNVIFTKVNLVNVSAIQRCQVQTEKQAPATIIVGFNPVQSIEPTRSPSASTDKEPKLPSVDDESHYDRQDVRELVPQRSALPAGNSFGIQC